MCPSSYYETERHAFFDTPTNCTKCESIIGARATYNMFTYEGSTSNSQCVPTDFGNFYLSCPYYRRLVAFNNDYLEHDMVRRVSCQLKSPCLSLTF